MSNISILIPLTLAALVLCTAAGVRSTIAEEGHVYSSVPVKCACMDIFCQRGGGGHFVPSPPFCPEDQVVLYARTTFCDWPEQHIDVAFQILDPCNRSFVLSGRTNASGIATVSFRLSSCGCVDHAFGTWRAIATASIAEVIVGDRVEFQLKWNLGDVNADGVVNVHDVALLSQAYTSTPSDPHWNQNCDVAQAYTLIDIYDVVTLAASYGKMYLS